MTATYICILTAFSLVPQKESTRRCCFIHLKNLCEALHNFFYDKHIIMQSRRQSCVDSQRITHITSRFNFA